MFQKSKFLKFLGILGIWIFIFMLSGLLYNSISRTNDNILLQAKYNQPSLTNKYDGNSLHTTQKTYKPYMEGLDVKQEPNELELQKLLTLEQPNVPFEFWLRKTFENSTRCMKYPSPLDLHFHNTYWQTLELAGVAFQLYGAYLDKRAGLSKGPVVRILAMVKYQPDRGFPPNYCQLWYDQHSEAVVVPVAEYELIWPKTWGYGAKNLLYPVFLNCLLPEDDADSNSIQIPKAVSVVPVPCAKATNSLRVHYEAPPPNEAPRKFAICVKGIDFPRTDISARLVEWLELVRLLGADRIFAYHLATHPNVRSVLEHYQKTGFVEMRSTTLATGEPGLPHFQHFAIQHSLMNKRLNEMIVFNDCLYRQMYKYDYIVAMDIDEVIMPLGNHTTWHDILEVAEARSGNSTHLCPLGYVSFCFNNVYFPSRSGNALHSVEAPAYMHMLQHVYRYGRYSPLYHETKCFHHTRNVLMLHNHIPVKWFRGVCNPFVVEAQHAQLQHYKVSQKLYEGEALVLDRSVWRYKESLVERTQHVLRVLGLIS